MGWYPGYSQALLNQAHAASPWLRSIPPLPVILNGFPLFFLHDLISSTLQLLAILQLLVLEGTQLVPPQGLCTCDSFHLELFSHTFAGWTPHLPAPSTKKPLRIPHGLRSLSPQSLTGGPITPSPCLIVLLAPIILIILYIYRSSRSRK